MPGIGLANHTIDWVALGGKGAWLLSARAIPKPTGEENTHLDLTEEPGEG